MKTISRRNVIRLGIAASIAPIFSAYGEETGDKPLGIALLGLGDYATNQLAPALKQTTNARLTGIVTGSPDKIPRWQKEHGIKDGNIYNYQNFDTIADNKDIDIVYVVTPTAQVITAAGAGSATAIDINGWLLQQDLDAA